MRIRFHVGPFSISGSTRKNKKTLNRVGLPKLPIHSLRHTHAVLMLEACAEMKYIQPKLVPSSFQVTSDIYSVNKFENYINCITNKSKNFGGQMVGKYLSKH